MVASFLLGLRLALIGLQDGLSHTSDLPSIPFRRFFAIASAAARR